MSAPRSAEALFKLVNARRSVYPLSKKLPAHATPAHIQTIVQQTFNTAPSAFNSQPVRAVVLFGAEHEKLWDIARSTLREIVKDEEQWKGTSQRMDMFKGAAGTVLFFSDEETTKGFQANIPLYADRFPKWADQANGMHQYLAWSALAADNIGANLQHYNPLIDSKVQEAWGIPASWKLDAQLVFGGRPEEELEAKEKKPTTETIKVFGA